MVERFRVERNASLRKMLRSFLLVLVAFAAFAGREKRAAAAASARLVYGRGPGVEGCPDEAGLRRAIADRVGYDPVFPIAPNDVEVTITRAGDHLAANVGFVDRNRILVGSRAFQAPVGHCDDLVATIALSVAIALDQFDKTRTSLPPTDVPAPATPAETSPPTAPEPPTKPRGTAEPVNRHATAIEVPDSHPRPAASRPLAAKTSVDLAVGMAGWLGVAPAFSFGPTALASVRTRNVTLGVEGRMALPATASVAALPTGQVRVSLVGAGPVACLGLDPYFACAVAFVGSVRAEAPGVPAAVAQTGIDVLAGARAGVAIDLGLGLSLRVSLDLLAVPYGPTLRVLGNDVWQPSPVAGGAQAVLAWRIP